MDAWETLISNSTLSSGDAWEHLNNQSGGGITYLAHGVDFRLDEQYRRVTIVEDRRIVNIENGSEIIILSTGDETNIESGSEINVS